MSSVQRTSLHPSLQTPVQGIATPAPLTLKTDLQKQKIPTFIPPTKIHPLQLESMRKEDLIKAVIQGNLPKTYKLIIYFKENLDTVTDHLGNTLLYLAVSYGHLETVKFLLTNGANPNKTVGLDRTPLHRAAMLGRTDIIGCLIEHGANSNTQDFYGQTPLHFAAMHGKLEATEFLVEKGEADPFIEDRHRMNPMDWAHAKKHEETALFLFHAIVKHFINQGATSTQIKELIKIGTFLKKQKSRLSGLLV